MPIEERVPSSAQPPYALENGDSLCFLNVSGDEACRDILVKDRYGRFWILNRNLEPLWRGQGQTRHFPYPFDIDGDGLDELLIGYSLWDHTGQRPWSHDEELAIMLTQFFIGNLSGDPVAGPRAYVSGSDEGLLAFDKARHNSQAGAHRTRAEGSVGKFRPELPGLQYVTINFWKNRKNPGIVTLFDADGNILAQEEPIHSGSSMLPVNWRGDGQDFVLPSGNVHEGGMIDGQMRRVVIFPDDGHPDLCSAVADFGDGRDEVILWDQDSVWIYTNQITAPTSHCPSGGVEPWQEAARLLEPFLVCLLKTRL